MRRREAGWVLRKNCEETVDVGVRRLLRRLRASGSIEDDDTARRLRAVVGARDLRSALTALVESALRDDDPRFQQIIVQSDIEGRPGKQIAAELHVSERTYYRLRSSALAGLQRSFDARLDASSSPASSDALGWYGRGLRLGALRTRHSLVRALACFQATLRCDPHFVRAYAGIADVQLLAAEYLLQDPRQAYGEARCALEAALERDPRSAEANAVAGDFALYARRDRVAARSRFDAALESDPLYAMTYQYAAWLSLNERDPERAARECIAGLTLRPDSMPLQTTLGVAYLELGRADRAVDHLEAVLDAEPGYWLARFHLAAALTRSDVSPMRSNSWSCSPATTRIRRSSPPRGTCADCSVIRPGRCAQSARSTPPRRVSVRRSSSARSSSPAPDSTAKRWRSCGPQPHRPRRGRRARSWGRRSSRCERICGRCAKRPTSKRSTSAIARLKRPRSSARLRRGRRPGRRRGRGRTVRGRCGR